MSKRKKEDPVTEFLKHAADTLSAKQRRELEQLQKWRQSDFNPEELRPLIHAYEPLIQKRMGQWRAPSVPEPAFRAEMQKHFIGALKSYDPTKGAALPTHIENRIRKAQRYNIQHQNVGYIPEAKASQIGKIDRASAELKDMYGRDPTHDEIGEFMKLPGRTVANIQAARVKDIPASAFEDDPTENRISQDREILALLPYRLDEKELLVFNHLFGREGAPQIQKGNELAARLNMSAPELSRIRTSIKTKYEQAKAR